MGNICQKILKIILSFHVKKKKETESKSSLC